MKKIIVVLMFAACCLSPAAAAYAEVLERIVAIVNEDIILLSEFQSVLRSAMLSDNRVTRDRVLNDMIDNMLLLNEAEKFMIRASDKTSKIERDNSMVVGEYIDRRIRALIHVPYEDIENYYQENGDLYRGKDFIEVRDEIEGRLVEKELKIKLREHLEELKMKAYIRIQLNKEDYP